MRYARCSRFPVQILAAAMVIAMAGCDNTPDTQPEGAASSPRARANLDCTDEQQVIEDVSLGSGGSVEGDVDGDGEIDTVQIVLDENGEPGCEAFLIVGTSSGNVSIPIWLTGSTGGLPQPSIKTLADVDAKPGLEIVVDEAGGASTQFAGVYTLVDGDLAWIELPESEMGLFAYGGSVGHLEAVDCAGDEELFVTRAVPGQGNEALEKSLYDVTRTTYSIDGGTLEQVSTETDQVPIDRLDRFKEFQTSPFGTCSSG
ncbi:MAG TPA: hypothetical protein VNP73_09180 [Actinomycetota bacterium]|nr:hypothetical protein [Actinomycetota bacterium]